MKKRGTPDLNFDPANWRMVAHSAAMRETLWLAQQASECELPVLLTGEPGTELLSIAHLIHGLHLNDPNESLLAVSAEEFSATMQWDRFIESRLAYGPTAQPAVRTLVITDLERLPLNHQRQLARYLAARSSGRSGTAEPVETSVPHLRLIGCTHQDLGPLISSQAFREDLYWQLAVMPIAIPPLRRRRDDLAALIELLLQSINGSLDRVDDEALQKLLDYSWPGNGDELANYLRRASALTQQSTLTCQELPHCVTGQAAATATTVFRPADNPSLIREFVFNSISNAGKESRNLYELIVQPVEKELLLQVMQSCQQVQTRAAQRLGMNRNTLYKKLKDYGLEKSDGESE